MASPLPLPLPFGLQPPRIKFNSTRPFRARRNPNPSLFLISAAASSDSDPSWEREEIRWLREEQRWLREEQRWIREESRWRSERESLLREIAALRLRIEALERERPSINVAARAAKGGGRNAAADGSARPVLVGEAEVKEVILEEKARVSEQKVEGKENEKRKGKESKMERRTLRTGSEGEDVRAMQEALLRLGFYAGEEDMEFSSFSTGTERAVKTWQASLGTSEDGIMTSELLERLFMERGTGDSSSKVNANQGRDSASVAQKGGINGAAVASVTEIAEIQQAVIKESGDAEVEVSQHRVFLLGENRWEEPSRLAGRNNPIGRSKAVSSTKCLTCRGEGRLMCTECDGSGEPNIEPQFLEWVDEGAKCPYCEGLGYTICDVCEGKSSTG